MKGWTFPLKIIRMIHKNDKYNLIYYSFGCQKLIIIIEFAQTPQVEPFATDKPKNLLRLNEIFFF